VETMNGLLADAENLSLEKEFIQKVNV